MDGGTERERSGGGCGTRYCIGGYRDTSAGDDDDQDDWLRWPTVGNYCCFDTCRISSLSIIITGYNYYTPNWTRWSTLPGRSIPSLTGEILLKNGDPGGFIRILL